MTTMIGRPSRQRMISTLQVVDEILCDSSCGIFQIVPLHVRRARWMPRREPEGTWKRQAWCVLLGSSLELWAHFDADSDNWEMLQRIIRTQVKPRFPSSYDVVRCRQVSTPMMVIKHRHMKRSTRTSTCTVCVSYLYWFLMNRVDLMMDSSIIHGFWWTCLDEHGL